MSKRGNHHLPGRRRFLKTVGFGGLGLGLAAGGLIPSQTFADKKHGRIIMRDIPASGESVPAVGLGTARTFDLGNLAGASSEQLAELREVLRVFHDLGGRLVDTSPMYGSAEELIGRFAGDLGITENLFMVTKVWTRGRDAGKQQMERSMELLHSDPIDMMQIHNLLDWKTHYRTLREWQEAGRIRYIGITHYQSSAHEEVERILKAEPFDMVQINYNVLDRHAEKSLLPLAQDMGLAVLINEPFGKGNLFPLTRGLELPAWAAEFDAESWAQVFLKFILGHPAVTCPIPATSNPRHMADNIGAAYGRLPDEKQRRQIASFIESL
jgi:diketogulonate reductase-like aldo/keto reductase